MRSRRGRAEKQPFLHACTGRDLRISRVDLKQCRSTACHYRPQQSTKMANAVAQIAPWVKFTVAKSSRKSCWVRSPQKITVVAGLKSGRKVTIVTTIVLSRTVVSSTKLTNPVTLKTGLPDRNVKRPPP